MRFNLTREERRVILFLIAVATIGMGINFLAKINSHIKTLISYDHNIGKVNLNTADKDLLINVPGIGEKLAQRIVEYRQKQVIFGSVEELKNIKGITHYNYKKIKDSFIVK